MTAAKLAQKRYGRDLDALFKACSLCGVKKVQSELFTRFEFSDGSVLIAANGPFTASDFVNLYDAVEDGTPI